LRIQVIIYYLVKQNDLAADKKSRAQSLAYKWLTPAVPAHSWEQLNHLYLWHFLEPVSGFNIPKTLNWNVPFQYKDHFTGSLILLLQLLLITPVIKVLITWNKMHKELVFLKKIDT